ncbi:MAG: site-2 protease family protein [Clostridiales bacterium]|nr:site-2 protease family protein [Clostridiales bacterium]
MSLIRILASGDFQLLIIYILSRAFVVFICLPAHELAHGWAAYKLGDNTAKNSGRLTFSPFAHLDPIGTLMIFLFGIGYAKPVPVNPNNFKKPKSGMALTALAGPASNLVMGFIGVFLADTVLAAYSAAGSASSAVYTLCQLFYLLFWYSAQVNVSLAVFNLLPIPPLDGSRVLAMALPDRLYYKYMRYERIIMIVLMVALFTGILSTPLSYLINFFMNIVSYIPDLIFGL